MYFLIVVSNDEPLGQLRDDEGGGYEEVLYNELLD